MNNVGILRAMIYIFRMCFHYLSSITYYFSSFYHDKIAVFLISLFMCVHFWFVNKQLTKMNDFLFGFITITINIFVLDSVYMSIFLCQPKTNIMKVIILWLLELQNIYVASIFFHTYYTHNDNTFIPENSDFEHFFFQKSHHKYDFLSFPFFMLENRRNWNTTKVCNIKNYTHVI